MTYIGEVMEKTLKEAEQAFKGMFILAIIGMGLLFGAGILVGWLIWG